jgi:hypothetical protein
LKIGEYRKIRSRKGPIRSLLFNHESTEGDGYLFTGAGIPPDEIRVDTAHSSNTDLVVVADPRLSYEKATDYTRKKMIAMMTTLSWIGPQWYSNLPNH